MNIRKCALALIATFAFAMPATATPVSVAPLRLATYTGYLDFGFDQTGEFGTPLTDLTGKNFVAKFTYDARRGNRTTSLYFDTIQGGPSIPPTFTNPILRATLEIDGVTRDFSPRYSSLVQIVGTFPPFLGGLNINSDGYGASGSSIFQHSLYMQAYSAQPIATSLYTTFGQRNSTPAGSGLFQLWTFDSNMVYTAQARGGLVPQTFELAAVPEPASWALMITGFAMTGVAMRRRRRPAAA